MEILVESCRCPAPRGDPCSYLFFGNKFDPAGGGATWYFINMEEKSAAVTTSLERLAWCSV